MGVSDWKEYFDFLETDFGWVATCFICNKSEIFRTEEEAIEWAWHHYHREHKIILLLEEIEARPGKYFDMRTDEEGEEWVPLGEVKRAVLKAMNIDLEEARKAALESRILKVLSWYEEGLTINELEEHLKVPDYELIPLIDDLLRKELIYEVEVGRRVALAR